MPSHLTSVRWVKLVHSTAHFVFIHHTFHCRNHQCFDFLWQHFLPFRTFYFYGEFMLFFVLNFLCFNSFFLTFVYCNLLWQGVNAGFEDIFELYNALKASNNDLEKGAYITASWKKNTKSLTSYINNLRALSYQYFLPRFFLIWNYYETMSFSISVMMNYSAIVILSFNAIWI